MKICGSGNYVKHISIPKLKNHSSVHDTERKNTKNFDAITISSRKTIDADTFARELSQKILKEVSSPSDPQKVEELKTEVQNGSYQIVIDEIAKKMLLA